MHEIVRRHGAFQELLTAELPASVALPASTIATPAKPLLHRVLHARPPVIYAILG